MTKLDDSVGKAFAKTKVSMDKALSGVGDQLLIGLKGVITEELAEITKTLSFPKESIPTTALNFKAGRISGNNISGGTIKSFSSQGIEDLAKGVQLTVMDKLTVVENQLVAASAEIKGDTTISGKLTVKGGLDRNTNLQIVKEISKDFQAQVDLKMEENFKQIKNAIISGDRIKGGTITDFSSTGIEDRASDVKLTILDKAVVFENKLVSQTLDVKGDVTIDGNLVIKGNMPLDSNTTGKIVNETAKTVYDRIEQTLKTEIKDALVHDFTTKGLDAKNLTVNGKQIFDGQNTLSPVIRKSKLTEVGILKALRVQGEAEFPSMIVGHNRVGINTRHPSAALAVWDDEAEVLVGKLREHTSFIGSHRRQDVVLTSGGKENIKLQPDGGTVIKFLIANQTLIASAPEAPNFDGEKGDVLFNTQPELGGPWGWMCLGGSAWAEMGVLK
jgi:RNase P/RNase MRP subunit p29